MSNTIGGLSAKEQKRFSKLITKKLEVMGLKDIITMHPTGKKTRTFTLNPERTGFVMDESGKPKITELDVLQARNILRNMVRNMRRQPYSVILNFLNLEIPKQQ